MMIRSNLMLKGFETFEGNQTKRNRSTKLCLVYLLVFVCRSPIHSYCLTPIGVLVSLMSLSSLSVFPFNSSTFNILKYLIKIHFVNPGQIQIKIIYFKYWIIISEIKRYYIYILKLVILYELI